MKKLIGFSIILIGGIIALMAEGKMDYGGAYLLGFIIGHVSAFAIHSKAEGKSK